MDDPRLQALHSRSARDLIRLFDEHRAAVLAAAAERPLLGRIGEGREALERRLDEELETYWRLWLVQAQATNDLDQATYSHGVFDREPRVPE